MFPCQKRMWFVLALLEKWVSCLNKSHREVFLLSNFLPAALSPSVIFFVCITACVYVCRDCKMLCTWVCLWVYTFLFIRGILPRRKGGNTCPSICAQKYSATINMSLCDIVDLGSVEECDIWLWLELIVIQPAHSHAAMCARTHTHPGSPRSFVCVCVCVMTTHLFHIEALLHQRMLVEPPFASGTIWKCFCLVKVVWELFSPSLMMIPACWWFIRGSSGQFVARMSFMGEG